MILEKENKLTKNYSSKSNLCLRMWNKSSSNYTIYSKNMVNSEKESDLKRLPLPTLGASHFHL